MNCSVVRKRVTTPALLLLTCVSFSLVSEELAGGALDDKNVSAPLRSEGNSIVGDHAPGDGNAKRSADNEPVALLACADVVPFASDGERREGVQELHELLDNMDSGEDLTAVDRVLHLTAQLRSSGLPSVAHDGEAKLVGFLGDQLVQRQEFFRVLQRAYHRDQIDFLLALGQSRPNLNWRLRWLVAKASGDEFLLWRSLERRKMMTPDQRRAMLKRVALDCTEYYEKTVSQAPSQYLRTQIASEWQSLAAYDSFGVDSALMRRQFPTDPQFKSTASEASIRKQAERVELAARDGIEAGRQGRLFAPKTRVEIVRSLVEEFKIYARIGIPDHVLDNVVRDLPFFFDVGMPMALIRGGDSASDLLGGGIADLQGLANMFRWYLWRSIVLPVPDQCERVQIDRQINQIAEKCRGTYADFSATDEYVETLDAYVTRWVTRYAELRDNRFVPYFKRVLSRERYDQIVSTLVKNLNGMEEGFADSADLERRIPHYSTGESAHQYGFGILVQVFTDCMFFDRPDKNPLPDTIFYSSRSTVNKYDTLTFLPGLARPY